MKIKFLSNEALIDLKMNFESYKEYLLKFDDEWIDQYLTRENRILESSIDLKEIEFNYDDNYAISDRENVKKYISH